MRQVQLFSSLFIKQLENTHPHPFPSVFQAIRSTVSWLCGISDTFKLN